MNQSELEEIMSYRPSVLRNSFLVMLVRVSFGILSPLFILVGAACIIGGKFQELFFLNPMVQTNLIERSVALQLQNNTWLLGIVLLIIGALGFIVVWLCRKLIERNWFLMELESWRAERSK